MESRSRYGSTPAHIATAPPCLTDTHIFQNIENQDVIVAADDGSDLCISSDQEKICTLLDRAISRFPEESAYDIGKLQDRLQEVAQGRIHLVNEWIRVNTGRFPVDNPDILALLRSVDAMSQTLLASVLLCRTECSSCRLKCVGHRTHVEEEHDCGTSHSCRDACSFSAEHEQEVLCGLP